MLGGYNTPVPVIASQPHRPEVEDIEPPPDHPDDGDPGDDNTGPWVTVAAFWKPDEAHIARLRLESEGIPVLMLDENLIATDWLYANAAGGIKLQVPQSRAAESRVLLSRATVSPASHRVLDYADPNQDRDVLLARFPVAAEAQLAANVLDAWGFEVRLFQRTRSNVAELWVPSPSVTRSREILQSTPAAQWLLNSGVEATDSGAETTCVACGSRNLSRTHHRWVIGGMISLLLMLGIGAGGSVRVVSIVFSLALLPAMLSRSYLRCNECGRLNPAPRRTGDVNRTG